MIPPFLRKPSLVTLSCHRVRASCVEVAMESPAHTTVFHLSAAQMQPPPPCFSLVTMWPESEHLLEFTQFQLAFMNCSQQALSGRGLAKVCLWPEHHPSLFWTAVLFTLTICVCLGVPGLRPAGSGWQGNKAL